nr:zinc-ribbon domain-containing protein [Anaerolineae bacterium]
MICPQCGTENPEGARFCMGCASRLVLACAECGSELPHGARFCINCAAPAPAATSGPEPPKAKQDTLAERLQRLVPKEY